MVIVISGSENLFKQNWDTTPLATGNPWASGKTRVDPNEGIF